MTIGEILAWIEATPNQHHAIGRYQVIPKALRRVVQRLGLEPTTRYDRKTQDLIGRFLIAEAGYADFFAGRMSRSRFMDNLARVWAGLPLENGRSAYHGHAGNRATISRRDHDLAMSRIFPDRPASR